MKRERQKIVKGMIAEFETKYASDGAFVAELRGDMLAVWNLPMTRALRAGLNALGLKLGTSQHVDLKGQVMKLHVHREVDAQEARARGGIIGKAH